MVVDQLLGAGEAFLARKSSGPFSCSPRGARLPRVGSEVLDRGKIPTRERPDVEGVIVGPKERERRLAKQRVDRSHRRRRSSRRRRCRRPPWTLGEKLVLVLSFALLFAAMALAIVMFVLPT
jgi:hypothetical protein